MGAPFALIVLLVRTAWHRYPGVFSSGLNHAAAVRHPELSRNVDNGGAAQISGAAYWFDTFDCDHDFPFAGRLSL
jgi:hypothetical protein